MSILDQNVVPDVENAAKRAAERLTELTRITYMQMVMAFNQGSNMFWNNVNGATPQDIAAELGTNAKEIFELHSKLGQLIASVKPEAIAEGSSVVGQFTMNEDGTITINS